MANQQQQPGGQASAQEGHGQVSASEIEKYVGGIDFPTGKDGLVKHARDKNAPDEVLDVLNDFPDGEYGSAADVAKAIGQTKH